MWGYLSKILKSLVALNLLIKLLLKCPVIFFARTTRQRGFRVLSSILWCQLQNSQKSYTLLLSLAKWLVQLNSEFSKVVGEFRILYDYDFGEFCYYCHRILQSLQNSPYYCHWQNVLYSWILRNFARTMRREGIWSERWGAGVETQKIVRGDIRGWGRVPFNEPYAPLLSTIYDGA